MQEEIRVMTLVRKAKLTQRDKALNEQKEERFFTTDYFDMLIATQYPLDTPLNQWMSEDTALTDYSQETAVQRYPLYFSRHIYEKYECDPNVLKRGDPFEKSSGFKFLSVIQVYIAPEILKRLDTKMDVVWHPTEEHAMLDPFLDDLYDTVECFIRSNQNQEFVYRIYYALSAGDFTIIIKSRTPELSFGISTYLRSRISEKKWAVYKTYTLLAMEDDIEGWESDLVRLSEDGNIGKFVLRGCYSWKYWAECSGNEDIDGIDRLNGRYDISAELTEQEFTLLYNKVAGNGTDKSEDVGRISGKVKYLIDLIDKEYLSYINERYLMHGIEIKLKDTDTVSSLMLDNKDQEDFYILNQNFIDKLRSKHEDLNEAYVVIYREHKSLRHYFELLKRQIDFCSVLNEQSDTRIYASGMEQLLWAVLDSLSEYKDMYLKERGMLSGQEYCEIGGLIVNYVGKSVYSINTYMEYVRNNNLQSLQTPNYNIESDMGMEKVLIGYSEYLREFVRFYVKSSDCMSGNIDFLPIVVPNICDAGITVEVLFPTDKIFNFPDTDERKSEKLLIINSPSMMELEDVPMAMAMLCHEIAHQFRYESREERNSVLLQLFTARCADVITEKILTNLRADIDEIITFPAVKMILQQELSETLKEVLVNSKYRITMQAPLDHLNRELEDNLSNFFREFSYTSKLDKYVQLFIRQVNEWENVNLSAIGTMEDFHSMVRSPETVEKYLSEMARIGGGEVEPIIYLYMDELLKQIAVEEQDDIDTGAQEYIVELHKRLRDKWQEKTPDYADKIGNEISVSEYRMWALTGRYLGIDAKLMEGTRIHDKNKDRFLDAIRQVKFEKEDMEAASASISTYREITSDIFMCCVMGLSPFAYINVIVTNMWRGDLIMSYDTMETIERVITVILAIGISDKDNNKEQALKEYNEVCMEILDKTGDEIREHVPEECETFQNLSLEIRKALQEDGSAQEQMEALEQFRKNMETKYNYKSDFHLKIDKILLVYRFLIYEGETYIDKFYKDDQYPQACEWEFLKQDYDKACKVLKKFREKMKDDVKMAQLDRLHGKISVYLNRLYETGKVLDGDLNRKAIEYLLKMYYNYKFHHAGGGGEV